MAGFSNFLENELLDHVFGGAAYTAPGTIYMGLNTADPGETGANELSATNGYARVAVAFGTSSSGTISNTAAETWTASGGNWTPVTHFSLWDNATVGAGNNLFNGTLGGTYTVTDGSTLTFAIGDIDLTVD